MTSDTMQKIADQMEELVHTLRGESDWLDRGKDMPEPAELKPGDKVTAETVRVADVVEFGANLAETTRRILAVSKDGDVVSIGVNNRLAHIHWGQDFTNATLVSRPDPFTLLHVGSKVWDEETQCERLVDGAWVSTNNDRRVWFIGGSIHTPWDPDRFRQID